MRAGILAVVLAVMGAWVYSCLHPELSYQGKTMSDWLNECCRSGQRMNWNSHKHDEAVAALRQIGSNAVPYLIEQAFSKGRTSAAKSNIVAVINAFQRWRGGPLLVSIEARRDEASLALMEIKPSAGQILPFTTNHLKSSAIDERCKALFILGTAGDGAKLVVPYLEAGLKDNDPWAQTIVVQSFQWIGPPAADAVPSLVAFLKDQPATNKMRFSAAIALGNIGSTNAVGAAPIIKTLFEEEKNWYARRSLAGALFRIDPTQSEALAFLIEGVTNHQPATERWWAVFELGRSGPAAKAAAPVLIEALNQTNSRFALEIPEALRKMGVTKGEIYAAIEPQLHSSDEGARADAAVRMLTFDPADHEAHSILMGIIQQGSTNQEYAIDALGNAGPQAAETLPLLRRIARESADMDTKGRAVRAVALIERPPK